MLTLWLQCSRAQRPRAPRHARALLWSRHIPRACRAPWRECKCAPGFNIKSARTGGGELLRAAGWWGACVAGKPHGRGAGVQQPAPSRGAPRHQPQWCEGFPTNTWRSSCDLRTHAYARTCAAHGAHVRVMSWCMYGPACTHEQNTSESLASESGSIGSEHSSTCSGTLWAACMPKLPLPSLSLCISRTLPPTPRRQPRIHACEACALAMESS